MKMKGKFTWRFYLFLVFLVVAQVTLADEPSLDIRNIPDSVRQHATAVLRFSSLQFEVSTVNHAKLIQHYAVTIFKKDAAPFGRLIEVYDPSNQIKKIRAHLYDEHGSEITKISSKDIKDYSAVNGGTLYTDDRLKYYSPQIQKFPYTVEYQIERQFDGLLFYPVWMPQSDYNFGVEKATFTMSVNKGLMPRYKTLKLPEPKVDSLDGFITFTWNVNGLVPLISEPLSIPVQELVPVVYTAPTGFSYAKYSGDMSSWEGIGNWVRKLNKDRQELPPETVAMVKEMVSGTDDVKEVVKKVYDYVQHHTRYVSVQLGIGGYQPWPASFVDEQGYGDCKALVNYTEALLNVAGIKSGYTLVRAGNNAIPVMKDFPSIQFNHVILTVPDAKDTLWLECTSQTIPFDYIGHFAGDRAGLMVTDNNAQIIHTRTYRKEQNLQVRRGTVHIDQDGNANAELFTTYKGLQYENVHPLLMKGADEQKKILYQILDIPDFIIDKVTYSEVTQQDGIPSVSEDISCRLNHTVTMIQQRAIMPVNLMNKIHFIPAEKGERKTDFELPFSYTDYDTLRYILPENLVVDRVISPVHIETPFGTYDATLESNEGGLLYVRTVSREKGRYPAALYDEYVAFRKEMQKADNRKLLLKMKPR